MQPASPEQPQPDRPRLTNLTLATGFAPDKRSRGGSSVVF